MMDVLGYVESITAQGREHLIYRMLSVKELPDIDAGGAQVETATGVGVEENGPVVKLLTEHDVRVGYGSFIAMGHETPRCNTRTRGRGPVASYAPMAGP
jgi:hypothetical protein